MSRLEVLKTYKIYIGGQFPRTESGRYYPLNDSKGKLLGNICLSSKKDIRNAVVAARKAFGGWSERAPFNRGQILYRIAEMLEGRKEQFIAEMVQQGLSRAKAEREMEICIDRTVYYAGWSDKFMQISSAVNPVSSSHFNFTVPEPMGVVGVIAPQDSALLGLISLVIPSIAGGNTCVVVAAETKPLCAVTFAEVLNSSDLPGGVVNILTGSPAELVDTLASHMDVNAIVSAESVSHKQKIQEACIGNVKRSFFYDQDWLKAEGEHLHFITDLQEYKTTWHPIENIGGATSNY
jgi:acyl-CoA reductase-like NAD-dependent aldehyde dehydrogenase